MWCSKGSGVRNTMQATITVPTPVRYQESALLPATNDLLGSTESPESTILSWEKRWPGLQVFPCHCSFFGILDELWVDKLGVSTEISRLEIVGNTCVLRWLLLHPALERLRYSSRTSVKLRRIRPINSKTRRAVKMRLSLNHETYWRDLEMEIWTRGLVYSVKREHCFIVTRRMV